MVRHFTSEERVCGYISEERAPCTSANGDSLDSTFCDCLPRWVPHLHCEKRLVSVNDRACNVPLTLLELEMFLDPHLQLFHADWFRERDQPTLAADILECLSNEGHLAVSFDTGRRCQDADSEPVIDATVH